MDWTLTITVASFLGGVLAVLGLWQRSIARERARWAEQATETRGSEKPAIAQHPQINPYLCLGCSNCVRACPEHGALALVQGRARLVTPSRCVGHGYCEKACPVGALTVGLGDTAHRSDLPILTAEMETSVPGVFMAGELGGIALIRNAIEQGRRVVETISRRLEERDLTPGGRDPVDVVVVGGGPAGIAASLQAVQGRLSCIVLDQNDVGGTVRKYPRNKLTMTQPVDLPILGRMRRTEYTKEQLIELWEDALKKAGIEIRAGVKFTGLDRAADGTLLAQTTTGLVRCRYLVLALGRRGTPRRLGVPGEDSENVLYELSDATSHSHESILVVGGGDSAIEAAGALATQPGNRVTLSYRREAFFRLKEKNLRRIATLQKEGQLRVLLNSEVKRIDPGSAVIAVRETGVTREVTLPADYVFVFAGGEPPYPLLKSIGIRFGGEQEAATETDAHPAEMRV